LTPIIQSFGVLLILIMAVLTVDLNRCWLISRGKEVFYSVKTEPDSFIQQVVEVKNPMNLRVLYVAMNAFKIRQGKSCTLY
jgi:hypothetical protein